MPKDDRLYAKFTLDFPDSPKIAPLSDTAFRALVEMVCWSRRLLTDGFVPEGMFRRFGTEEARNELLTNDPVNPSVIAAEGGYLVHDFADHQTTKAEVEEMKRQKREAGAKGGRAKAAARQEGSKDLADAKQTSSRGASRTPSEIYPETETETSFATDVAKVAPAARGTRIPDPFIVTTDMRRWATESVPAVDVNRSTEMFVNHFRAKTGRDATKADWPATWRNWLLRDQGTAVKPTAAQRNLSTVEHFAALEAS